MNPLLIAAAAVALLAAGYALGRIKPSARASSWAHWLFYGTSRPTRRDPRWWLAQAVFLAEIVVLLSTRPRQTVHAWQHRNDPPPPRSPAVQISTVNRDPEEA